MDSSSPAGVGRMREDDVLAGHEQRDAYQPQPPAMPLLRSKLVAPALPDALVERPRLGELLAVGMRRPVTLVAAPAGWGKTVLLSWWSRTIAAAGRVAWLSIEPGDEGRHFWSYLHAALSSTDLARQGHREALPPPETLPHELFLARLADALARAPDSVVLVLDDLHHVRDGAVVGGLEFLLRHAGGRLRLVIGTRAEPPLPLHRWRLSGELSELRTEELSFTRPEAAELLARQGLALPDARLGELYARTEGWPAGLRLAAFGGRSRPEDAALVGEVGGDHHAIADYLIEEVLVGQPADVREALLRTSIVDRMSGGVVDALTGRTDGERFLAELDRANLFVVPLGTRRCAYRYHRLFGEVLRAELRREAPELIPELHRRAARWHTAHDLPIDALRHALAAQDWGYATGILVDHWHDLAPYGHDDTQRTLVPPPPPDGVKADPELALAYAADRLDLHDLDSADRYLRLADRQRHLLADDRRDRFALIRAALRLAEAQLAGDAGRVLDEAPRMLALVRQPDPATQEPLDEGARAIALTALGSAQLATGDATGAESSLGAGLTAAQRAGLSCPRLACSSQLALVRAVHGELRCAERGARAALDLAACPGQSRPVHRAHAYLALALVNLQWDRLDDASASLDLAARSCDASERPLAALIAVVRVQLLQARGDLAAGYQALLAGRRDLGEWRPPRYLEHWFAAVEADLRTARGDTGSARELLAPLEGEASAPVAAALARVHLSEGDPNAALRALPPWSSDDGAALSLRLDAGLLEALAARRLGDARRATRALERVLELAEPEGFRLVFTRAGTPVRELLADHLDSGTAYWFMASELTAATGERPAPVGRASVGPGPPALGEPLTEREMTVLRYLQSILSTVEIASELCVSVNTVKTHVRNIYRKLAATRRRDAVRRARELHLL